MKVRSIKKRIVARMLACEVVTFSWAWGAESDAFIRTLINKHAQLMNVLRAGLKEVA